MIDFPEETWHLKQKFNKLEIGYEIVKNSISLLKNKFCVFKNSLKFYHFKDFKNLKMHIVYLIQ